MTCGFDRFWNVLLDTHHTCSHACLYVVTSVAAFSFGLLLSRLRGRCFELTFSLIRCAYNTYIYTFALIPTNSISTSIAQQKRNETVLESPHFIGHNTHHSCIVEILLNLGGPYRPLDPCQVTYLKTRSLLSA
jgi:glucan phosphoethanolaminetransferase (alkaline phosphatase superfamily)